jgi:diguanylate cyclase (GGDEF)-like protein
VAGRRLSELAVVQNSPRPGADYWRIERPDGSPADVEVAVRDLRDDPTVNGTVYTVRDVTEPLRLERELTYLAFHDSLTGLPNRVRFGEAVQQAVTERGPDEVVGVLFIDVDDFKVVNDTMGHDVGDRLLEEVARRLSTVVGGGDLPARLGGDEFAILVHGAGSPSDVEDVAEQVVAVLSEPVILDGSLLNASASIGVATTEDARGKGDLLRHADLALYVAKGSGKGRWRRFQSVLHAQVVKRLELRAALDRAVAHGDFALAYQPIVALTTGATVGFEALLRWDDPERGLVLPGEFIDLAEDSGLIVPIGNWALQRAFADAAGWSTADGTAPYLSINVSVRQFRSPGLVDTIERELRDSGLPPGRLLLEITESLLLRDDERVWNDLARLRDKGIRIAIDDFGTGYSSLSYLRQVPVNVLKIDKSFIDTMATSPEQRSLVETIVRLARTLGLDVVAEGIQRPEDRDMLAALGCQYGQGYLFSKAMPDAEVGRWLAGHLVRTA